MFKLPVYNQEGKQIETQQLDPKLFDGLVNRKLIYQIITNYLTNRRKGCSATKTRAQVSGGGAKPWRQKGTGRARAGSIRSPIWIGGGVAFGPHPRNRSFQLPKNEKRVALKAALNHKLNQNELIIVDKIILNSPKTKQFKKICSKLKLGRRPLFLLGNLTKEIILASGNIPELSVREAKLANTYEILAHSKMVVDKEGLKVLESRVVTKRASEVLSQDK